MSIMSKHNPDYKLISMVISQGNTLIELVYGESNEGENKGLEAYYHKDSLSNVHYRSSRWAIDKVPAKYKVILADLMRNLSDCPAGHKLSFGLTSYN